MIYLVTHAGFQDFPVDRFQRNVDVVEDQGKEKVPRDNLGPALVVTISLMDLQWTQ